QLTLCTFYASRCAPIFAQKSAQFKLPLLAALCIKMNIEEVAKSWIEMWKLEADDPRRDQYEWLEDIEYEFVYEKPDKTLDLILAIMNFSQNNAINEVLAAGPLAQFLAQHGPEIIERVEQLAQEEKKFANLLGGV
ncbi:DUF6869 domain-containing protein, partial [Microbulbifer mangrovi]|uniref:DUF6869 domain-containing protein n=1 Tax=Microbulbifer mangrovi TaxID=927787 RepID=UPI0019569C27